MKELFFRGNQYLFFLILTVVVLYFGRPIVVPFVFAALLAMLMKPLANRMEKHGIKRVYTTIISVFIILLALLFFVGVIAGQVVSFSRNLEKIEAKAKEFRKQAQSYIESKYSVPAQQQEKIVKEQAKQTASSGASVIGKILTGLTSLVAGIVLTLVYTFLLLFNRERFRKFLVLLYSDKNRDAVADVIRQISNVSQKYLTGRALSILIIAGLYAVGLSIIGLENALLLAGAAAVLTLIPYVGTILGGIFPVLMALVTADMQTALAAGVVLFVIQTLDNYFIEPNVVGGEVNLSALTSIIVILAGGLLWGVAGMVLFIPIFAIIKIICDHVEPLKPIGVLLGEEKEKGKPSPVKEWIKHKIFRK